MDGLIAAGDNRPELDPLLKIFALAQATGRRESAARKMHQALGIPDEHPQPERHLS